MEETQGSRKSGDKDLPLGVGGEGVIQLRGMKS